MSNTQKLPNAINPRPPQQQRPQQFLSDSQDDSNNLNNMDLTYRVLLQQFSPQGMFFKQVQFANSITVAQQELLYNRPFTLGIGNKDAQITELQNLIHELQEIKDLMINFQEKEEYFKQIQVQQITKSNIEIQYFIQEIQKTRQLMQEEYRRIIEEREQTKNQKKLKETQKLIQKAQQQNQQRDYNLQKTSAERLKLGQLLINKAMRSMGQMEVYFVDVTNSMDPYKKQTEDCIMGSVDAIKKETGRDAVAYQDIYNIIRINQYFYSKYLYSKSMLLLSSYNSLIFQSQVLIF